MNGRLALYDPLVEILVAFLIHLRRLGTPEEDSLLRVYLYGDIQPYYISRRNGLLQRLALDEEEGDEPLDYDITLDDLRDVIDELSGEAPEPTDDEVL